MSLKILFIYCIVKEISILYRVIANILKVPIQHSLSS